MTGPEGIPDPNHPGWAVVNGAANALDEVLGTLVALLGQGDMACVALLIHREGPAQLCAAGPEAALDYVRIAQALRSAADQVLARHQAGTS